MIYDTNERVQTILKNTFTVSDVYRRLGLLRSCFEFSLFTESNQTVAERCTEYLKTQGNKEDSTAILQWGDDFFESFSSASMSDEMKELHNAMDGLPVFNLYIPVMFSDAELDSIGKWCRDSFSSTVLLDIHIDPNVTGGCSFVWNDEVHEFSFRSRMKQKPHMVTELLSKYV